MLTNGVKIMRIAICSQYNRAIIADYEWEWPANTEKQLLASLCGSFLVLAKDLNDEAISFASFEDPARKNNPTTRPQQSSLINEQDYIYLGLQTRESLIVGCVYKIMDEKREERHDAFLNSLMQRVLDGFIAQYGEYHQSQKDYLESLFNKDQEIIKPEVANHFAQFSEQIPSYLTN